MTMLQLRRVLMPLLLPIVAGAPGARDVPRESALPFVLTRLSLDLRVDYARGALAGTAGLDVRNDGDRPFVEIPLLLGRLMTVTGVEDAAGRTLPFVQDVVTFSDDPIRQVNTTVVRLQGAVGPGDTARLVVHYGGILVGYVETGSLYVKDRVAEDFTILREDAYAFPTIGVPSWESMRTLVREPFGFAAEVTVPAGLTVAMGGAPLESRQRDSLVTWRYRSGAPVPFLNITIAPYRVTERGGSRIFHFPADSAGARMVATAIDGAMERFTRWYGPLSESPRLVVIEIPEGFGSQASLAAGVILTADAFGDPAELPQLYHELSHIWNVPDLDRPSPRWNEGLASFLQWRMAAALDGWADADAQRQRSVESVLRRCAPPAPCDTLPMASYGVAGSTGLSYSVGLLMFAALYESLGESAFDRAYRGFFQRYGERGATSAQLIAAFHDATGGRSDPVFDDWFLTARWHARLTHGESFARIVASYGRP
jgi:hypothetical protein